MAVSYEIAFWPVR